jgi:hypothetical protein
MLAFQAEIRPFLLMGKTPHRKIFDRCEARGRMRLYKLRFRVIVTCFEVFGSSDMMLLIESMGRRTERRWTQRSHLKLFAACC